MSDVMCPEPSGIVTSTRKTENREKNEVCLNRNLEKCCHSRKRRKSCKIFPFSLNRDEEKKEVFKRGKRSE